MSGIKHLEVVFRQNDSKNDGRWENQELKNDSVDLLCRRHKEQYQEVEMWGPEAKKFKHFP